MSVPFGCFLSPSCFVPIPSLSARIILTMSKFRLSSLVFSNCFHESDPPLLTEHTGMIKVGDRNSALGRGIPVQELTVMQTWSYGTEGPPGKQSKRGGVHRGRLWGPVT